MSACYYVNKRQVNRQFTKLIGELMRRQLSMSPIIWLRTLLTAPSNVAADIILSRRRHRFTDKSGSNSAIFFYFGEDRLSYADGRLRSHAISVSRCDRLHPLTKYKVRFVRRHIAAISLLIVYKALNISAFAFSARRQHRRPVMPYRICHGPDVSRVAIDDAHRYLLAAGSTGGS